MTLDKEALKKCELKYFTKPEELRHLVVLDPERVHQKPFWRNDVVKAWCLSGAVGSDMDFEFGCDSSYWLGIYDNGKIDFHMDTYGGMCSYHPENFLDAKSIENKNDRDVQVAAINAINQLIDDGVLGVPEKKKAKAPDQKKTSLETYVILRTDRSGQKTAFSGYTSKEDAYQKAQSMAEEDSRAARKKRTVPHTSRLEKDPQRGMVVVEYDDCSRIVYEVVPGASMAAEEKGEKK